MLVYLKNVIFFVFLPFIKNLIFLIPLISAAIPVWAKDNRPAFNSSRYKENYKFLQDRNKKIDLFDSIKYIPFNNTKTSFLTIRIFGLPISSPSTHFIGVYFANTPISSLISLLRSGITIPLYTYSIQIFLFLD